jgi:general stress protein YciG
MADNGIRETRNRGFAAMDAEKQRNIASKGGRAAHESGNAHEFTPNEARAAGRKGGKTVSMDRGHMAEIGRKGGEARGKNGGAQNAQAGG